MRETLENAERNSDPDWMKDQHELSNEAQIELMVKSAELGTKDIVLEIGGGRGNITKHIVKSAGKVIVVERDAKFVEALRSKFWATPNVEVIEGNIMDVKLPAFSKIISNTPFSILQPFFIRLIKERRHLFEKAILIVPAGFAERITATPGSEDFGQIGAMFMAFYDTKTIAELDKSDFTPPPSVDSVCINIHVKPLAPASPARYLLQQIFLLDEKKVKNIIVQTLWNKGPELAGKSLTKKQSKTLFEEIFGKKQVTFEEKKVSELTNEEFRKIVSALLNWEPTIK